MKLGVVGLGRRAAQNGVTEEKAQLQADKFTPAMSEAFMAAYRQEAERLQLLATTLEELGSDIQDQLGAA